MSTPLLNTFSKFQQTEQEQLSGTLLTTEQKQFIQTQVAQIAEQRIATEPDPNNYAAFIQQEAFLKGQMTAYLYLLDCSKTSEDIVYSAAQQQK